MSDSKLKNICPLCNSQQLELKETFTPEELMAIWQQSSFDIQPYLPAGNFSLLGCSVCQLHFFVPLITSSGKFYADFLLNHNEYYRVSWDHQEILKYFFEQKFATVLDYGCGEGAFLKLLPQETKRLGIDFNCQSQEKGSLKIIQNDLLAFQTKDQFEAVICVQVLEHLSDAKKHLDKMISLLKPGGWLFLSVPNQEGILSLIEPAGKNLDFPPHHLTRWTKAPLLKIAELFNLKMIEIKEEPLSFTHFRWAMNSFIGTRYNKGLIQKVCRKFLLLAQEAKLPLFYPGFKKKVLGHSLLAVYQKSYEQN